MNKESALKRLYAIEAEAKELRKIIDGKIIDGKIVYKDGKLYIGVMEEKAYGNGGYILVGHDKKPYFRFHYFYGKYLTEQGWSSSKNTAQECIDDFVSAGGIVHEFDNVREGFAFFLSKYQG